MAIDTSPTHEDIEQHEIAEVILLGLLRTLLNHPGSLDHEGPPSRCAWRPKNATGRATIARLSRWMNGRKG